MKVLILANHLNIGGITVYILNLCRAFHGKNGMEIVVASRGGDQEKELAALGVEHIFLPLTTKCEVSPKVFFSFCQLKKIVMQEGVDVIHANTRVTQVLAALLSRATRKPYLSTCHGYFKPRISRKILPCWGRRVIAISDQVRSHLIDDFHVSPDKIDVIYNGIDCARFHPYGTLELAEQKKSLGLNLSKKIVGHIGRLSSVKGQKFFVLAAAEILRRKPNVQFFLVGDGREKEALQKLVRDKNLEGSFLFVPSVSDTSRTLAVMDVFVMPSLEEGLGLSILEAQAQGVPVVASAVGGILTVIEDQKTGLLVRPQEPLELANAIMTLLDRASLRESIIKEAREQVVDKFSLDLMARKIRQVYDKVMTGEAQNSKS